MKLISNNKRHASLLGKKIWDAKSIAMKIYCLKTTLLEIPIPENHLINRHTVI